MEIDNNNNQNGQKQHVIRDNTGMGPPPTDLSWPPPPPSPTLLSAGTATFIPTSSLLGQARGVLYSQTPYKSSFCPYVPTTYEYNTMPADRVNLYQYQSTDYQSQQTMGTTFTTITTTTSTTPRNTTPVIKYTNATSKGIEDSQAPPWASQMLQRLNQIESHMLSQNAKWQTVENTLSNQNLRMSNMEQQVRDLKGYRHNMTSLEIKVDTLTDDVSQMTRKVNEYEATINTYSDMYDNTNSDQHTSRYLINELSERVSKLENDQDELQPKISKMDNDITDLQCRSMRDNLIFTGISEPEPVEGESEVQEDVENTLNKFLKDEMNITNQITFHRVHRINVPERDDSYPRPIVAKFEHFKAREYVRLQAPKTLRGKPFGVREQFPKVVENRRKLLYPEMKRARANKHNKVRLVKDKLFINDVQYIPDTDINAVQPKFANRQNNRTFETRHFQNTSYNRYSQRGSSRGYPRGYSQSYQKGRTFNRSTNRGSFNAWTPRSSYAEKTISFASPNIYANLPGDQEFEEGSGRSTSKKNKASSPLDYDKTSKKYRDDDSENPEEQVLSSTDTELGAMEVTITKEQQQEQLKTDEQNSLPVVDIPLNMLNDPHKIENTTSDVTENQRGDEV